MSNIPKVSVIIPVYNTEKYLRECLDSVVTQTLKDIEIICVDDGSTDNSLGILKEYAANDDRFIIIEQENKGAGAARNRGLEIAKGEYISFLDGDDIFKHNLLEETYNAAKENSSDLVCFQYNNYNNDTNEIEDTRGINLKNTDKKRIKTFKNTKLKSILFEFSNPMPWNKLIKRQIIADNNIKFQTLTHSNDIYFSLVSTVLADRITIIWDSFVYYRYNRNESLKNTRDKNPYCFYEAYKEIYGFLNNKHLYKKYEKTFLKSFISTSIWTVNNTTQKRQEVVNFIKNTIVPEFEVFKSDKFKLLSKNLKNKLTSLVHPTDIIVSLTSYPARINTAHLAIESILNQTIKADKIILWLAEEQFPNKEQDLPQQLLNLKHQGLEIEWYYDIKSYKKLIPTLKKYPQAIIVTADDDNIYDKKWLEKLYRSYLKYPKDIQVHRVTKFKYKHGKFEIISGGKEFYKGASYLNKVTGVGGVLYPPNCFYKDILNENLIMQLAPTNDDQWFWLQAALNGTKVRVVNKPITKINYIPNTQETALCKINDNGEKLFWKDFNSLLAYYPKLKTILVNEYKYRKVRQLLKIQKIFSAKNKDTHKIITICGLKIKFKSQKLVQQKKNKEIDKKFKKLNEQIKKLKGNLANQQKSFRYELCKYMPNEKHPEYLKDWYKRVTGETLNLDNPQTYNEKIQWLKLYDSTPIKTQLADKYLVRDWVKEKIGEEYLIPLLGVWDNFDDINFDELPNKFVLKCNHGSGYNIIVSDKYKLNIDEIRKKINNWMNENFAFKFGMELHYSAIPRKIIAEKYLDEISNALYDYRFFCTKGKCVQIWVDEASGTPNHKRKIYDCNWNELDIIVKWPRLTRDIEKPKRLTEMIHMAEKMSENFYLVRVDFYYCNDKIYFGEMTFTSMSGIGKFEPEIENYKLGQMIKLPTDEKVLMNV